MLQWVVALTKTLLRIPKFLFCRFRNDDYLEVESVEEEDSLPASPPVHPPPVPRNEPPQPPATGHRRRTPEADIVPNDLGNEFDYPDLDEPTGERLYRAAVEGGHVRSLRRQDDSEDSVVVELVSPARRSRRINVEAKTRPPVATVIVKPSANISPGKRAQRLSKTPLGTAPLPSKATTEALTRRRENTDLDVSPPSKKPRREYARMRLLDESEDEIIPTRTAERGRTAVPRIDENKPPRLVPRTRPTDAPEKIIVKVHVVTPNGTPTTEFQEFRLSLRKLLGLNFFESIIRSFPDVFAGDPTAYLEEVTNFSIGFRVSIRSRDKRLVPVIKDWPNDFKRTPQEMGWTNGTVLEVQIVDV
ncbi:hypothetical protein HDU93_003042 [Gonapodya sp. JEL0774]|nr:hypothetical protein HDU93_003042 [Gonapodya sp. JEL0774]